MTVLDNIKKIAEKGCNDIICEDCPLKKLCDAISNATIAGPTVTQELLNSLSYDADLSECEVGDWVWE